MKTAVRPCILTLLLLSSSGQAHQTPEPHDDCRGITLLAAFARIYGTADVRTIERKADELCGAPMGTATLRWPPDKKHMKSAGRWLYPNGSPANSSGGAWYYPNNKQAKSAQGAWRYPDDSIAKSATGQWRTPYGRTVSLDQLRTWARDRVEPAEFGKLNPIIGLGRSDEEIVAALELAWMAR